MLLVRSLRVERCFSTKAHAVSTVDSLQLYSTGLGRPQRKFLVRKCLYSACLVHQTRTVDGSEGSRALSM